MGTKLFVFPSLCLIKFQHRGFGLLRTRRVCFLYVYGKDLEKVVALNCDNGNVNRSIAK